MSKELPSSLSGDRADPLRRRQRELRLLLPAHFLLLGACLLPVGKRNYRPIQSLFPAEEINGVRSLSSAHSRAFSCSATSAPSICREGIPTEEGLKNRKNCFMDSPSASSFQFPGRFNAFGRTQRERGRELEGPCRWPTDDTMSGLPPPDLCFGIP